MDETNKNDFPLKVLDGTTQLDMIEKKLDAIINHLGIEFQDTSREAVANNKELADFHGARCQKIEFLNMVRDYLKTKEKDHGDICIKVLQPWSFDVRSTNLGSGNNQVTLWADEKGDHFKAKIAFRNRMPSEISIRRFPLLSDDKGVVADIAFCNFTDSFADAIINHKIEISDLGSFDVKKCRSISEDFDEWWFGMCFVGETVKGTVRILKKIDLAVNGEFVGSLNAVGSADLTEITVTRKSEDDTADFTFGDLAQVIGVNFNKLGRFLYHCILMDEIEIPGFTEWRRCKYNGPAIPE